ncbi:HNH endonuclease [Roseateles sp. BYS78W]|uniref:HNH endonuclease signature motif containing protein n=1 Tax=Pelomonas candidula TaxID=3299025 RepID=UPI00374A5736
MIAYLLIVAPEVDAKPHRSSSAVAQFKRQHPCPANGATKGSCPGYVVDHVVPLCAGGADAMSNMQWQTIADAKAKDRDERAQCRASRKHQ